MSDGAYWIVVRDGVEAYELRGGDRELAELLETYGECVHLVPGRVWRDYRETAERLAIIRNEMRTYRRAAMVPRAVKEGFPMPTQPPKP